MNKILRNYMKSEFFFSIMKIDRIKFKLQRYENFQHKNYRENNFAYNYE